MTRDRYTADTITDDALDRLYENANKGWRRGDEWKARAERAEAAVTRARTVARLAREQGLPDNQDLWELAGAVLDATEQSEESTTP
ncbi:hypothetical protein PV620_30135 [Streptomyces sp. ME02-6978a]|uniref:hypothetical protein n=1 Tax=unclassified Streptomyces TaxID=2593676 RepID=UPI0029B0FBBF|nr:MULTISPECIES: hypothetical protein [unclassified Streptomyces]MDX3087164.1 hypothetical protein [Streptomyces sp. ME12-02E]MDX3335807.1 hypothetical protein [Streptomyces sp. ME02-6978a]